MKLSWRSVTRCDVSIRFVFMAGGGGLRGGGCRSQAAGVFDAASEQPDQLALDAAGTRGCRFR